MIIEILQLFDMLAYGKVHVLFIFFIFFIILPSYLIRRYSDRYHNRYYNASFINKSSSNDISNVTVIIPVHTEDYNTFDNCLASIKRQSPDQLIISIDSKDQRLINIAEKYGAEILKHDTRSGKRKALADAWLKAKSDIIVHVDSDVILQDNCLKEIVKPFDDSDVAGISTVHICTYNGSMISYILASSIESARCVNDKALNGNLVVVDGKCSAWKRNFLLNIKDKFLKEYWMGIKCEIGDDRFLSREALKAGHKTVYNESAKVYTSSPNSFMNFIKQQIRWRRSGTKFWIKDLKEGLFPTRLYTYKCAVYYSSPIIFPLAIILDIFIFKLSSYWTSWSDWGFWDSILLVMAGTTLVSILVQMIYFGKVLYPRYVILQGLVGLFIMLPVSIYGMVTIKRQDLWMTRKYVNEKIYK